MRKEKYVPIGVRLGGKSLKWARQTAVKEGITFSQFIRRCLAREIMAREAFHTKQVKP